MRPTVPIALAAALLAVPLAALAVLVKGLYEATVPVADQGAPMRDPALQQALQAVLVRVTGTRQLPEPAATSLRQRASVLVQGYGYEAAPTGQTGLRLHAQFDARAVDAALRSFNLPVWGANRLSYIAWVALREDGQPRAVLDAASVAARAGPLLTTADARGLPITFPALDATERRMVTFNELWSGNFTGVQGASRRYGADLVLVARIGREGGRWLGRWTLVNAAGSNEEWTGAFDTLDEALASGVHELADRQAQRYATQTGTARELHIQVAGVESLRDYGRVLTYLRGLNPVRAAQVEAVQSGALTLRLRVEGDPEMLTRVIAAGSVLRPGEALFSAGPSYVLVR